MGIPADTSHRDFDSLVGCDRAVMRHLGWFMVYEEETLRRREQQRGSASSLIYSTDPGPDIPHTTAIAWTV